MRKPKVVLVAGSPRGGTTISSMVLGQHPAIFSTGSLADFPQGGGMFDEENVCSCGSLAHSCGFWQQVRERYLPFHDRPDSDKIPALFNIVSELSGREFVGDITHNMGYAKRLMAIPGIDLHIVHVVRDGRGVVYSRTSKDYRVGRLIKYGWQHFKRVVAVSRHWSRHARQFSKLQKSLGPKAVTISYEQLCSDPQTALEVVGHGLGLDFAATAASLAAGRPMSLAPHLIRGNPRLRAKTDVRLRYDDTFRREMLLRDRVVFQIASRLG